MPRVRTRRVFHRRLVTLVKILECFDPRFGVDRSGLGSYLELPIIPVNRVRVMISPKFRRPA